jgi:hypothetical protein
MRFLIDALPNFCPGCGEDWTARDPLTMNDFMLGCSFTCTQCGAKYQRATRREITELAQKCGDAAQYWDR